MKLLTTGRVYDSTSSLLSSRTMNRAHRLKPRDRQFPGLQQKGKTRPQRNTQKQTKQQKHEEVNGIRSVLLLEEVEGARLPEAHMDPPRVIHPAWLRHQGFWMSAHVATTFGRFFLFVFLRSGGGIGWSLVTLNPQTPKPYALNPARNPTRNRKLQLLHTLNPKH